MFLRGEYTSDNATYGVLMEHTRTKIEILLVLSGTVVSAYKMDVTGSYSYNNNKAKELASTIQAGLKGCTKKRFKGTIPGAMDVLHQYEFTKAKTEYIVQLRIYDHVKELGGISFQSDNKRASIVYANNVVFPENIPYVKLTEVKTFTDDDSSELDDIQTRSVQEIALEKEDVSWLLKKKYYIIKDDEQAEQLFSQLEQYGGLIAYDTETTGLKMNCYSKIGSKYMADLDKYNTEHPDDQMRADRLVGIIFCVEPDVSYYFPCFNRKFKNLYQDKESPWRKKLINNIRARYTIGDRYNPHSDMYKYITTTPDDELRLDVLLMERVRNILEKKDIATHHGAFEWKVGWCYEIDTNIKEDSMLMHQLMYKFRSTTRNSGEPSNLKYLARVELGIDQWELKDFFPNFKEDKKGTVRRRPGEKKNTNIDFSYMDEEGARVYAPCDGDVTLQLCFKYKTDMLKNHKEIEYLYQVEILVSMAIGYMEFYGHRIDESKILDARLQTQADIAMLTEELRQEINYNNQMEDEAYAAIKAFRNTPKSERNLSDEEYAEQLTQLIDNLNKAISGNAAHVINLSSPAQVGELFYDKLGYPMTGDKKSVDKKTLKALIKEKDENGNLKYPVVKMYRDLKDKETLLSKFFDNLNYFMYIGAGGLIFSSYGQIATATGRMSCIEENQYVTTVGGSKKIKDIKPGELVYCYDDNGNIKISKVNKVIDKGIQNCIKLNWVSKGSNKPGSLICTPDHRIKLRERGWVQACDIEIGDRAYHVTRSDSDRPRIYGANGFYEQEQILIKKEYFGVDDTDIVVHHIDENTRNNDINNLALMTREEHSRLHGKELAESGRIRTDHLELYTDIRLKGKDHPKYISKTYDELKQMLIDANGVLTKVGMDFGTYKKKCNEVGFDYMEVIKQLRPEYKDVDLQEFVQAFMENNGTVFAIANELGIGRTRVQNIIEELGLDTVDCCVDKDDYIAIFKEVNGDCHKLSEKLNLTIREVQTLNRKYNLVTTDIDDDDFIEVFNNCNGSVRAVARHYGITFYKASKNAKRLGLAYNHTFTSIEAVGERHVYDLEIDGYHNFIASEICVHNCNKPNAQQYPKVITKIVVPRPGYVMVDADYSQIEYRVLTALAKNDWLAKLFSDPDSDYHTLMASLMYDVPYSSVTPSMRSAAKSFNFGIPYGMGLGSLAILLTGKNTPQTRDEAAEKMEDYFKNQPKTRQFFTDIKESAKVNGYTKTAFGRRRYYTFTDKDGNVDNGRMAAALRQAGNAVIQGTAADVFKISVARNFSWIRANKLLGLVLIINMIHDEQLMEIDAQHLNVQRALAEIGHNMQFDIDGFPPLYIGAGVGKAWGYAKGKMAEIHPVLLQQYTEEARAIDPNTGKEVMPLWLEKENWDDPVDTNKVLDYFEKRVIEFRRKKVADYITDPSHFGDVLHPAIAGLINLQFNYGRGDDAKAYTGPNGEKYDDAEFLKLNLTDFIKENHLDVDPDVFKKTEHAKEEEPDDDSYDDNDDGEDGEFELDEADDIYSFSKIDESDKIYGSSIRDLVSVFKACVLEHQKVVALDTRDLYFRKLDAIADFLNDYVVDETEPGNEDACQIVFLTDGNVMKYTGIYVKGITQELLERVYKLIISGKNLKESDFTAGDVKTRSQAK